MRTAVVVHLYYPDLWPEFSARIRNVRAALQGREVDVSVTLPRADPAVTDAVLRDVPDARVDVLPNRGLDVGPFLLWMWRTLIHHGPEHYDVLLKMHTKKGIGSTGEARGEQWRHNLCDALAGSPEQVTTCLAMLRRPRTGMVGSAQSLYYRGGPNRPLARTLVAQLGLRPAGGRFVAGTMFWAKPAVLFRYLTAEHLRNLYRRMPEGYCRDGTVAHALERLFGHMVEDAGLRIDGVSYVPRRAALAG